MSNIHDIVSHLLMMFHQGDYFSLASNAREMIKETCTLPTNKEHLTAVHLYRFLWVEANNVLLCHMMKGEGKRG